MNFIELANDLPTTILPIKSPGTTYIPLTESVFPGTNSDNKEFAMSFVQCSRFRVVGQLRFDNLLASIAAVALIGYYVMAPARAGEQENLIQLTQTPCQFLETEGVDRQFKSTKSAECEAINAKTGAERLANSKVLTLKPGRYVFRVTNKNVPYELGFWLRSKGYDWRNPVHKVTKTSVSGGGLDVGATKDYVVELKPGEYEYSCPLNPTPDYRIVVTAG